MTSTNLTYAEEIAAWRQDMENSLRSETGWLTLTGLYWLDEGRNSVGADETSAVILPSGAPHLGTIVFEDGKFTLHVDSDAEVTVDGEPVREAVLRDSSHPAGVSVVGIGTVTFFVLQRGDAYAVRVRDSSNPARITFAGRNWFDVDRAYSVTGVYVPRENPRTLPIVNSAGQDVEMNNPGRAEFTLNGEKVALEAFDAGEGQIWFIFRDGTSGKSTYGAGRFLYATLHDDNTVSVDFNKAYHPPCAFTSYATCPYPPKENFLTIDIPVGERK